MPFVVRSDSENENEAELVFLSPDEEPVKKPAAAAADQGASPVLRRSNRKRKSTASFCDSDMSKNSGSKKKKSSPDPGKSMPRIPRTPQAPGQDPGQPQATQPQAASAAPLGSCLEGLLAGMEERLASKMDENNKAVKQTNEALLAVEEKVANNDAALRAALQASEARIMSHFQDAVKGMVLDQLRSAGFDPDLSAGALTLPSVTDSRLVPSTSAAMPSSYAAVTSIALEKTARKPDKIQAERREDRFWECRRSLRLWPVPEGTVDGLKVFLKEKLRMDERFIEEDLGEVLVRKHKDLRAKNKDEIFVQFESKEVRDIVKAQAPNLANYRETAGMRLHLPNHLQKDFKALMGLSYDLKKRNPDLKRNVKFDEDDLGLFMDIQFEKDGVWKRVKPDQARRSSEAAGQRNGRGPEKMLDEEIVSRLGEEMGSESE